MKIRFAPLCCLFVLGFGVTLAPAAVFSTNPLADAFVAVGDDSQFPNSNYGGAGALAVAGPELFKGQMQSVLQFGLAEAIGSFNSTYGPGGWSVQGVTLQFTATSPNNAIFNTPAAGMLGVSWMVNDGWQEGTGHPSAPGETGITFATLPGFLNGADENLGTFAFNGATSGTVSLSLALPAGFTADLLAGGNVSLRVFAADSTVAAVFNSRSFGTAANRPLLTITAVPEPGSALLCAAGLLLLTGRRTGRRIV